VLQEADQPFLADRVERGRRSVPLSRTRGRGI
jgi:hypothetical protein